MKLEKYALIAEVVSSIAIVATLIVLVFEIKNNSELIQSSTELEATRLVSDFHSTGIESAEVVRLWDHVAEPSALTDSERSRLTWLVARHLFIVEGLHRQYNRGFLPTESWLPYEGVVAGLFRIPWIREWYDSPVTPFSSDFDRLVQRLIESPPENTWRYEDLGTFGAPERADE